MMYPTLVLIFVCLASGLKVTEYGQIRNCVSLDDSIPSAVFRCDVSVNVEGELFGDVPAPLFVDELNRLYSIKYPFSLVLDNPVFNLGLYDKLGDFKGLRVEASISTNQSACPITSSNNGTLCQRSEFLNGRFNCYRAQLDGGLLNYSFVVRESGSEHVHIPYRFKIDGITGLGYYDVLQDHYVGPVNFSSFEFTSVPDHDLPFLYLQESNATTLAYSNVDSPVNPFWFSNGEVDFSGVCSDLQYISVEPYVKGFEFINSGFTVQPFRVNGSESPYNVYANYLSKGYMTLSFSTVVGLVPATVGNLTINYDCSTGIAWIRGINSGNAGSVTIMVHYSAGPKRSYEYNEVIVSGLFQIRIASYHIEEVWVSTERVRPSKVCGASGPTIPQDNVVHAAIVPTDPPVNGSDMQMLLNENNPGVDSDSDGTLTVFNIPINGYWYIVASGVAVVSFLILIITTSVCVYKRRKQRRLYADLSALSDTRRA